MAFKDLIFGSKEDNDSQVMEETKDKDMMTLEDDGDGYVDPDEITTDMLIIDIITRWPESIMFLMECGMGCISCGAAQFETLEQACMVHGIDPDDLCEALNEQAAEWE